MRARSPSEISDILRSGGGPRVWASLSESGTRGGLTVARGATLAPLMDTGVIHAISSDPVQAHNDCPAINEVGFLSPGETGQTFPLSIARTCGFHDHTNEFNAAFKGRIVIQ